MAQSLSIRLSCLRVKAAARWTTHPAAVLCTDCGLTGTSSISHSTWNQRTRGISGLDRQNYLSRPRISQESAHPAFIVRPGCRGIRLIDQAQWQQQFSSLAPNGQSQDQLVYQGRISHMFKALKLFSLTTSGIGLCVQPYLLLTYQNLSVAAAVPFFAAINMFVFMNPILIHFVAKKYVTQLYFNPLTKIFTANFLTFFARKEVLTFSADDVQVPEVPSMFAMLTVRGRPVFVSEGDFTNLEVYKHLMKFDQPIDLTYSQPDSKHNE